jgi:hypothetical protein
MIRVVFWFIPSLDRVDLVFADGCRLFGERVKLKLKV